MTSIFIPVANAKADDLQAPNPPKEYQLPPPKTEKYTRTYLQYNYNGRLSDPLFELSKTVANVKKKVKENKTEWKLNLRLRNQEDIRGCAQLDMGIRQIVFKYKGKYKVNSFTVENPGELRGIFFYSRDDSGNIIEGTDPQMSFKMDDKTAFKKMNFEFGPDGQVVIDPETNLPKYTEEIIDYKTLENKSFECGLVFCLRDLYHSNGMPVPQLFVRTCWVLSPPTERGAVDSKQSAVLKDFLQSATSEQLNTLMSMIDQLKSGRVPSLFDSLKSGAGSSSAPQGGLPAPAGVPALPTPPTGSQSSSSTSSASQQKQMPSGGHHAPQASSPTKPPAPTIDLSAYLNPGQSSAAQSYPQMPQGFPQGYQQMPPGYSPELFNQYLQSGAVGQPQGSVARI